MTDPHALIQARSAGEIRYAVVSEVTGSLSRVLAKVGLTPDESLLVEHDKQTALAILEELLWKDMAYEDECMPRSLAETFAKQVMEEHAHPESRYFSNGNWAQRESWNPLTESTFDAGLLITGKEGHYFCIWFQDED
jgi:hypothetical protein